MREGLTTAAIYQAWRVLNYRQARRFRRALATVAAVQSTYLLQLLRRNGESGFGHRYGFDTMRTVADYQRRVPVADYHDFAPAIQAIARGEQNLLTCEPALLLEPTSGSTGASKFIPCTASYLQEFQQGIAPWMNDLFTHYPALTRGTTFWALSPRARVSDPEIRLPVGFPDEMVYAGGRYAPLLRHLLAVPGDVAEIADSESYYYVTLLFLLQNRNLTWVSVWNPRLWLLFWDKLLLYWPRLVADLRCGALTPPKPITPELRQRLAARLKKDPLRAQEVHKAFARSGTTPPWQTIWPKLTLISCWGDAWAGESLAQLRAIFPGVAIQKKGLLATEALVTVPMGRDGKALLGVTSHFYEFLSLTDGDVYLAHQLEHGKQYEVVVTTGGGLYRYRLHDVVEVQGFVRACPVLSFIGRNDKVSDFFGEKLHAEHVARELEAILSKERAAVRFRLLACESAAAPPGYTLFLEAESLSDPELCAIARDFEVRLLYNYHYRNCRELGQLGPLRVFRISGHGLGAYLERCRENGQRLGDVKSDLLQLRPNWAGAFVGRYLSNAEGED